MTYGGSKYSERLIGRDEVLVCPPLSSHLVQISVYSYNSQCKYGVTVTESPMSIATLTYLISDHLIRDPSYPNGYGGYSYQIGDGVNASIPSGFTTPVPQYYPFQLHLDNHSCILHVESHGNGVLTFIQNGKEYDVTPYAYNGRSFFDVSICNAASASFPTSPVYFRVNTSDVYFTVFVTTYNNVTDIISFNSIFSLDATNILNSEIYVTTSSPLPCEVDMVWSSTSASPFVPPQSFLFPSNFSFSEIDWSVMPDHSIQDDRSIYTYLLLNDDFDGDIAGIMDTFTLSFGPGVVTQNGVRMTLDEEIIPMVRRDITCEKNVMELLLSDLDHSLDVLVSLNVTQMSQAYSVFVQSDVIRANLTWYACGKQILYMNGTNYVDGVEMCDDWNCVSLNMENYQVNLAQIDGGSCVTTANVVIDPTVDSAWYIGCKERVYSVTMGKLGRACTTDQDCFLPWDSNSSLTYTFLNETCQFDTISSHISPKCDRFLGICSDTQLEAEDLFWWCFVTEMSLDVQLTLSLLNIDGCNVTQLKSTFSSVDCVSVSGTGMSALPYRNHFRYTTPVTTLIVNTYGNSDNPVQDHCACYQDVGHEYDLCLDLFCSLPPPCQYTSFDRAPIGLLYLSEASSKDDVCSFSYLNQESDPDSCVLERLCNWNPTLPPSSLSSSNGNVSVCDGGISNDGMFCGAQFSLGDVLFHEIVNVSQSECEANGGRVCVTPYGSIVLGELTDEECDSFGYCTSDCESMEVITCVPTDRRIPSMCFNDSSAMDPVKCMQLSGKWEGSVCTFPLQNNRLECARNGNTFVECHALSSDKCISNGHISCYLDVSISECQTRQECEQTPLKGTCTDSEYFVNFQTIPPTIGSCVVPFEVDMADGRHFCFQNTFPLSIGCVGHELKEEKREMSDGLKERERGRKGGRRNVFLLISHSFLSFCKGA